VLKAGEISPIPNCGILSFPDGFLDGQFGYNNLDPVLDVPAIFLVCPNSIGVLLVLSALTLFLGDSSKFF
jgi:hypothetical protein